MKIEKKYLSYVLILTVFLAAFNLSAIHAKAVSKNSKIYKLTLRERRLFKKEAEYYGYIFTKDKLLYATKNEIRWGFDMWNTEPNSDNTYETDMCLIVEKEFGYYYCGYTPSIRPEESSSWSRELTMEILKKHSLPSSVHKMLVRKSTNGAKSLSRSIETRKGEVSEIASEYVKSNKTGRASFMATDSKGIQHKIVVKSVRKKKKINDPLNGKNTLHFIKTKYYLDGKISSKEKILKKF